MKSRNIILLLLALFLMPVAELCAEPEPYKKPDLVWAKRMNKTTGLYARRQNGQAHAVSLTLDAAYYYGDVENWGLAMVGGPLLDNISGIAKVNYTQPVGTIINIRYSLGAGLIRGDNSYYAQRNEGLSYRKFNSVTALAAVGVEVYPIPDAGFYIYAGLMFDYSHINYTYSKIYNGTNESFLPMIPIEIGYQFYLGRSWLMNVHVGAAQGLLDTETFNLDGYPHRHITSNGTVIPMGLSHNRLADGWFNLGITISYSWHNCETCRIRRW